MEVHVGTDVGTYLLAIVWGERDSAIVGILHVEIRRHAIITLELSGIAPLVVLHVPNVDVLAHHVGIASAARRVGGLQLCQRIIVAEDGNACAWLTLRTLRPCRTRCTIYTVRTMARHEVPFIVDLTVEQISATCQYITLACWREISEEWWQCSGLLADI